MIKTMSDRPMDPTAETAAASDEEVYVFPCSFAQQRLWFFDQLAPGSAFYNIPIAVRLKGALDEAALRRSVSEIVRRHETLRTTFSSQDGRPIQVIAPDHVVPIPVADLQEIPQPERESMRLADEEARQPFDLCRGPLLRIRLLRLGGTEHILLLTMHHIISDGWSITVFVQEMAALYHAFSSCRPSPLPELPIQYADFTCWQRDWLGGERLDRQLAYWKGQMGGDLPVLELPTDRPRPAVQTFHGASLTRTIPGRVLEDLRTLALREEATLFMVLLAAFQVLLYRYTGQEDLCVGSPSANRDRAEIEGLIGLFVNTLVLRTNLSGDPAFRELLRRVRETTLKAYENQDLPFEMVVEAACQKRDTSYSPLFQTMFILQNVSARSREIPGLTLEMLEVQTGTSTFDITLSVSETAAGLDASIEYNTELFDRPTVERFLEHFEVLLTGIAADPDVAVSGLPLLQDGEREQLLARWSNGPSLFSDKGVCVHHLFETLADLTPDAIAVVVPAFENAPHKEITYGELNRRANRLARRLRSLGVGPETMVGICAERSAEMLTAVLATLKSGGAYLALDPMYPPARLSYMVEDSGVRVIITQSRVPGSGFRVQGFDVRGQSDPNGEQGTGNDERKKGGKRKAECGSMDPGPWTLDPGPGTLDRDQRSETEGLSPGLRPWTLDLGPRTLNPGPPTCIFLDADWPVIARESGENLGVDLDPENLAYVVYTSGSTGRPKGVLVRHRNLVNAYLAWEEAYGLHPALSHLQMASFAFDVFSGDLVRALCSGGKMVLCPRDYLLEAEKLCTLMLDEKTGCAEFVPAVLRNLVEHLAGTGQGLGFMKLLICGSDTWTVKEYETFLRFVSTDGRLINSFGLAEATIDSSYFEKRDLRLPGDRPVPMGRPFAGTRLYVLDDHLQPQPTGVPGELYVGGAGVARGYLNRPGLSAERFVPDPFGNEPGACLYRTGDRARFLADGNIEFLGRMDTQVKIRGFRIETGEIESVLKEYPAVRDAAVIAVQAPESCASRETRLAAYVAVQSPGDFSVPDLRTFLGPRLPDYMIPSAFLVLDHLPLSPNGKLDRKAFPPPDWSATDLQEEHIAPRTPTEEMLATTWGKLLGIDRVSARANFFDLGGHSLLATQLVSRVRTTFQVEIPLQAIFEWPTLEELAQQIEIARRAKLGVKAPPIVPVPRDQDPPLSFSQQRLWFLDQLEPGSPFYNLPEIVRIKGPLRIAVLERCLNEAVRRHESLRTGFRSVEGKPVQDIRPRLDVGLPVTDLKELPADRREEEWAILLREEMEKPFDLERPPLFRSRILRLGEEEHIFLLVMHHIVGDDWSTGVLVQEITLLYDAFSKDSPSPLPEPPIQYRDFACWQRGWIQGEVLDAHLSYWKERLADLPPLLELPIDHPRVALQSNPGDYRSFEVDESLSRAIRDLCRREGVTLFMFLLASFHTLLQRYSGQETIAVGSPIANRNRAEVEGLIGFFVNTLVLRADFSEEITFRDLLRQEREATLNAYAHQDLPFEMVVDALQPERDLSHSPLFQVMLVLQNTPVQSRSLPDSGLTLGPVKAHSGTAKFDLTLFMTEEGDRLSGAMEYNTALFDASTVQRLLDHFQVLLSGVVESPDLPLSRIEILSRSERNQMLVEWNGSETSPSLPRRFAHEMFEAQAERTPDAVAAACQDRSITYQELSRRSNQLALYLRKAGIGPESLVGLCMERSLEMMVGILGILKAGGAYVPLDPSYPPERLSFMVEDSGVRVILTQSKVQGSGFRVQGSEARDQKSEVRGQRGRNEERGARSEEGKKGGRRKAESGILDPGPWTRDPGTLDRDQRSEVGDQRSEIEGLSPALRPWTLDLGPGTWDPGSLPPTSNLQPPTMICLDADWPTIAPEPDENPAVDLDPSNLAYVIYTSGSTGKPKGAMITHEGFANYLDWVLRAYPLSEGRGSPVHSSISFDLTVTSLFAPLISGSKVMLLPEEHGVEALTEAVRAEPDFTLVKITPAHLQVLGEQIDRWEAPSRTRAFIIGGENLLREQCEFWKSFAPDTALVNEYGPTETVVGCCVYWTPAGERERSVIPIGRPIINTRLYAVGRTLDPVPVGVSGELLIGGPGLARGYLNRPDRTAERFVPDHFQMVQGPGSRVQGHSPSRQWEEQPSSPIGAVGGQSGKRLYRTGDLVRYLPDGNLECLGRMDHQVKIRGFRVELGEIEAVLARHPALREVVVWPWEEHGHRRLVAYLVPEDPGAVPSISELRGFLQDQLPEYMVPSAFVPLAELPLTHNGKVDRKALPAPSPAPSEQEGGFVAPRSRQEQILADIWARLLGLERVGIHDNFFELGGDSILSIQVVSRAGREGIRFTPRQLFESPTIAGLVEVADLSRMSPADQSMVTGSVPLTPIQHWFFEQKFPEPDHWNQSLLLTLQEPLDRHALAATLKELILHHDALRLRFTPAAYGWEQFLASPDEETVVSWVDLSGLADPEQDESVERIAADVQRSLNLTRGPLLRAVYFDPGERRPARIVMAIHHLVVDGVSWQVLMEDFQAAYRDVRLGRSPDLPPKTTSFLEWSIQLGKWANSAEARQELKHWVSLAEDHSAHIPLDNREGENTEGSARNVIAVLGPEETRSLLQEVPRALQTTPNEVLLSALAWAVAQWQGHPEVLLELEGHGRRNLTDEMDLSRTVGWFTSLYPVRLDLRGAGDPGEALKKVMPQMAAVPPNGIGYGALRYLSEDEKIRARLRALPRPEISFNYFGQVDWVSQTAGEFGFAREPAGARSPAATRTHRVDVNGGILGGRLEIEWGYSENLHRRSTIEKVAADFLAALRSIIEGALSQVHVGTAPSDLDVFGWGQEELQEIVSAITEPDFK